MADYGMSEAFARKKRLSSSIANQQGAFLGQKRGTRNLGELQRRLTEGFQPLMAQYGQRGLAGPNVTSGIQRKGLERYAADMQTQVGDATTDLQNQQNQFVQNEADENAQLEDYVAQLRLRKQQEMLRTATQIKEYSAY